MKNFKKRDMIRDTEEDNEICHQHPETCSNPNCTIH